VNGTAPGTDRPEPDRPDETEAERDDRNLIELLQELRVAGLGVQVLFGFLLALPFTSRFAQLSHAQDANIMAILGLAAVGLAVCAAVLLVLSYVAKGLPAVLITVFVVCLFAGLWFGLPLARGRRYSS
jgi:hypothetical protein